MASACVNNNVGAAATKFSTSFPWFSSPPPPPRVSISRDRNDDAAASTSKPNSNAQKDDPDDADKDADFEFRLHDPVAMLPADELISDGKLMPMPVPAVSKQKASIDHPPAESSTAVKTRRITELLNSSSADPNNVMFSPRAPRCASRWKEIFGLKKLHHNSNKPTLRNFLHRNSTKSSSSSSTSSSSSDTSLPLLRDSDSSDLSLSISSARLSLSSSSNSSHELDDFPRLSLDVVDTKHNNSNSNINPISLLKSVANNPNPPPRIRLLAKPRPLAENVGSTRMGIRSPVRKIVATETVYADSPRMNPSGKIVFHSLERSSSSPGSFTGGPRMKHSGMERSYSANVRVTPVLNVPVCSLSKSGNVLGFGQLFSNSNGGGISGSNSRSYQSINNSCSSRTRNRSS